MNGITLRVLIALLWLLAVGPMSQWSRASKDDFASDRDGGFNSSRCLGYLNELCKLGPRQSGTPAMTLQQATLQKHFESLGATVHFQRFTARQKSRQQPVEMANLIVTWHPDRTRRVIVCTHYDTRPIADQEPDRRKWHDPFLSANDGTSGVALLMELGHAMKRLPAQLGVDFVFFDGEEYIFDPRPDGDKYFLGSEHFGRKYQQDHPAHRYVAAVLLDMIAGKDAHFPIEQNSWFNAAPLVQEVWQIAAERKCTAFQNALGTEVRDDHLALNKAGIPAIDIIDFNYPHWHRLSDVPSQCSEETLSQVARVVRGWLEQVR
jgi:glutaminyl-peptide cyclotransferase